MLENFYSNFKNYWRDIDKPIFFSFFSLFILGIFFSFASTSTLAGERLNKDYYFFFSKHLIFAICSISIMISIFWFQSNFLKKNYNSCFFCIFIRVILSIIFWDRSKRLKEMARFIFF